MEFPRFNSCLVLTLDASESTPVRGVSGGNSRTSSGGSSPEASAAEGRMRTGAGAGAGAGRLLPGAWAVSLSLSPRGVAAGLQELRELRSALLAPRWTSAQREGLEQTGSAARGLHGPFVRARLCSACSQETPKLPLCLPPGQDILMWYFCQ